MNSRTKGHAYERAKAAELREIWPECQTSRLACPMLDWQGVDLYGTPGYLFQLKAKEKGVAPHTILYQEMPDDTTTINVLLWKRNHLGEVVCLRKDDFIRLIKQLQNDTRGEEN
jgi:hypothetical protein